MPDDATPNTPPPPQDWRDLAQKASTELDPKKLTNIVSELLKVIPIDSKSRELQCPRCGEIYRAAILARGLCEAGYPGRWSVPHSSVINLALGNRERADRRQRKSRGESSE
jgi:predicted RNA-binding Zn-ribbon protein involved in translation (DUF1610 family)